MKVYLTLEGWVDFVIGKTVVAYKEETETHYKPILIMFQEVLKQDSETVTIIKKC